MNRLWQESPRCRLPRQGQRGCHIIAQRLSGAGLDSPMAAVFSLFNVLYPKNISLRDAGPFGLQVQGSPYSWIDHCLQGG